MMGGNSIKQCALCRGEILPKEKMGGIRLLVGYGDPGERALDLHGQCAHSLGEFLIQAQNATRLNYSKFQIERIP